jgi:acyl carrier protein
VQALLDALAEILDVEAVKATDELASFSEWDSLGVLSVIATVDSQYGVNLTATEVRAASTPQALHELIEKKKGK